MPLRHQRVFGLTLFLLGLLLFSFPTLYKSYRNFSLPKVPRLISAIKISSASEPIKVDSKLLSDKEPSEPPERIVIPTLNIDLPIVEAKVVNGLWETSQTSASHGIGSANPGENGNIVIFAHARDDLFGPLRKLKNSDKIYLLTKDHWYRYQAGQITLINPDQTEEIAPTQSETLTLYTCSGFLDSKRLIVTAKPS